MQHYESITRSSYCIHVNTVSYWVEHTLTSGGNAGISENPPTLLSCNKVIWKVTTNHCMGYLHTNRPSSLTCIHIKSTRFISIKGAKIAEDKIRLHLFKYFYLKIQHNIIIMLEGSILSPWLYPVFLAPSTGPPSSSVFHTEMHCKAGRVWGSLVPRLFFRVR